jgi:hypothetical protein
LASVLDIGAVQQQQLITVSAEEAMRGAAGGFFISLGGATNPGSPVPSPAIKVPVQRVAASAAFITFLVVGEFMFSELNKCSQPWSECTTRERLAIYYGQDKYLATAIRSLSQ